MPPSSRRLQDRSSRRLQDRSSRRLQVMSSRRHQDVFSVTIFRLPRRLARGLQNVFAKRLQDVLEDVKVLRWRRVEDVFKTNKYLLGLNIWEKEKDTKTSLHSLNCPWLQKNFEKAVGATDGVNDFSILSSWFLGKTN